MPTVDISTLKGKKAIHIRIRNSLRNKDKTVNYKSSRWVCALPGKDTIQLDSWNLPLGLLLPTTKRTICRKISFMFCVTRFKQRTPSTRAEVLQYSSWFEFWVPMFHSKHTLVQSSWWWCSPHSDKYKQMTHPNQ